MLSDFWYHDESRMNSTGKRKNTVNGLNNTKKQYLKERVELVGNLKINDTSVIGMLPYASKSASVNFSEQC